MSSILSTPIQQFRKNPRLNKELTTFKVEIGGADRHHMNWRRSDQLHANVIQANPVGLPRAGPRI